RQAALGAQEPHLGIWELADGGECRALHHGMVGNRTPRPEDWGPHTLDFSPDGRLLASSEVDGVRLWDPSTGIPLAYLPFDAVGAAAVFSPDGSHLLTDKESSDLGPRIWPLRAGGDGTEGGLRIGPPRPLGATTGLYSGYHSWDSTGRYVMVNNAARTHALLLDPAQSAEVARVGPHQGLNQCPISPDGRWVATATWKGKD